MDKVKDYFEELKKALSGLESSIKSDLKEIRKNKDEVQRVKQEVFESVTSTRYIHDDHRIVISAPEVIIGNVDRDGNLIGSGSVVVLRGNDISIEASGDSMYGGGSVRTRAPYISNIAVDPGKDGRENVLLTGSQIINQARGITLQTNDDNDSFAMPAGAGVGISLNSDTSINIQSTPACKTESKFIDDRIKNLQTIAKDAKSESSNQKKNVEDVMKRMQKLLDKYVDLNDSDEDLISNHPDLEQMSDDFIRLQDALSSTIAKYVASLSTEAETNRTITALKAKKDELGKKASDFAKKTTESLVSIQSETVIMSSIDGDGNIRENKEAGLYVQAPHIQMMAHDKDGKLIKDSTIDVNHQTITVSTGNPALDEKREKGDIPAVGDVKITSKNITLESLDYELKDKKIQEKALTKTGAINIRAEKIDAQATDTEGKSTGSITMNAKQITAASMDVDKEKRQPKQLAAGSQMVLVSEKMFAGSKDKKTKSKLVQLSSEKVGIMATSTAEMQQGDGKAVATLDGGNVTLGGSKVEIAGDMKFGGKADFSGDLSAPKGTFKNLEASTSFKSSNISDGIPVPAPSAPSKPSAKMKEEEAKQQ